MKPKVSHEALGPFPHLSDTEGNSGHCPHQIVIDVILEVFQKACDVWVFYPAEKPDLRWETAKFRILHPGVDRYLFPDNKLDRDIDRIASS